MDEQSILRQALTKESPAVQAQWLAEICGSDDQLKARVEALIQQHRAARDDAGELRTEIDLNILTEFSDNKNLNVLLPKGLVTTYGNEDSRGLGQSILKQLSHKLATMPQILLRDTTQDGDDTVVRPTSAAMPERTTDRRYRLEGEIARGGMGAILKGHDVDLGRDLAIKVLLDVHKDKPEVIQRFIEEAQIGGQLQHPGIAPVYELGQFADLRPFFSMKLVKGETLAAILARRANPTEDRGKLLGVFEQICQTMAYAHSRGVIHRDLKPANIMVGAFGEVQVMDWGLAKVLTSGNGPGSDDNDAEDGTIQTRRSGSQDSAEIMSSHTQVGSVLGTPAYMPPEQALGAISQLDERSDVFGLGAILCEILTGKPPYVGTPGNQAFEMASRGKLDDCFARLNACGADVDLIELARHCLQAEPDLRPRNAAALAKRVAGYLESVETKLRQTELERAAEAARADAKAAQAEAERQRAESEGQRLEQQQHSARRLRKLIAWLAALAVVAGIACVVAIVAQNNAHHLAQVAAKETIKAREKEGQAIRNAVDAERSRNETLNALATVESQKKIVEMQKAEVLVSLNKAEAAEKDAREAEEAGRKVLYTTDMQLAPFVWKDDRSTAAKLGALLAIHDPAAHLASPDGEKLTKSDLRGFEWYYFKHLLEQSAAVYSGHTAAVVDGAFTAEDKLITLDQNGQVRRWTTNLQSEEESGRRDLLGGRGPQAYDLSPNGRQAALAEGDIVHVFDTSTGQETFQVESNSQQFRDLIFSRNSERLVVVDARIRWFNAATGKVIASFDQKFDSARSLALSADGLTLAVTGHGPFGGEFSIFHLNASTNAVVPLTIKTDLGRTLDASALSPDGRRIAVGLQLAGSLSIYDAATGNLIAHHGNAHATPISSMTFSDDGTKVATADADGTIKIWDAPDRVTSKSEAMRTLKGHQGVVTNISFSKTGEQVITTSRDQTARVWNLLNAGASIRSLNVPSLMAQFSPDGHWIAVADKGSRVRLWNTTTGKFAKDLLSDDKLEVRSVAFSPTDLRLLAVGYSGTPGPSNVSHVSLWNLETATELARLPGATDLPGFALDEFSGVVGSLTFSPDGQYLVAGFGDKLLLKSESSPSPLKVWEVATRKPIQILNGHTGYCASVEFSREGARLASCSHDGTAIIWSTIRWDAERTLRNPDPSTVYGNGIVADVAFSPDGKTLALASREGTIQLWDVAAGTLQALLKGHSSAVCAIAFSPDGLTLASGSTDQTVRLWNVETRRELMQLDPGRVDLGEVTSLSFSSDGKHLLAGGRNDTAVWSAAPIAVPGF